MVATVGGADVAEGRTTTAILEETQNTSKCPLRTLISRAATRGSTKPLLRRPPLLLAKRHQKAVVVPMKMVLLNQGHRALRRRSRRRITRRSRSLTRYLRLLPRLTLGVEDQALGRVVHRDMVPMAVAVVVADVVEVGVIDAKRKEKRMWLRLASLVGWGFLGLVDMSVDGEDMAGEVADHDVVEEAVVEVGAEVRHPLFRLMYEGFRVSSNSLWFWGKEKEKG